MSDRQRLVRVLGWTVVLTMAARDVGLWRAAHALKPGPSGLVEQWTRPNKDMAIDGGVMAPKDGDVFCITRARDREVHCVFLGKGSERWF